MTDLAGVRMLVAEDDDVVRRLVVRVAESIGAEVHAVEDGTQALQALADHTFDVVVSDLKMPGSGGIEVLRAARRALPAAGLLAISGFARPEDETAVSELGGSLLRKPFGKTDLETALAHAAKT